jgi:hypothetical protein
MDATLAPDGGIKFYWPVSGKGARGLREGADFVEAS